MAVNLKTGGQIKPPPDSAVSSPETKAPSKPGELASVIAKLKKEAGDKSVVSGSTVPNPPRLPTGVFEFDLATGGGFPCGRYSIVYGPESSGKTNLVYKAIAQAQRRPPPCNKAVFVDLEGTFDPVWAAQFGVDVDALVVVQPSYGEQAVDMIDALVRADDVAILAVDSIAVLIAAKELEGSVEKADVGTSAMLIKRLSNKLAVGLADERKRDHNICVILLNQTRFKIGVLFGNPETMPGGQTVKFNSSLTVRVSGSNEMVKEISSEKPAFKKTDMRIVKAKIGIVQAVSDYRMCVLSHDGLMVGDTDSFNAVKGYLQSSGDLKKVDKGGWLCLGKHYQTLAVIQDTYRAEDGFALQLQQKVIQNLSFQQGLKIVEPPSDEDQAP